MAESLLADYLERWYAPVMLRDDADNVPIVESLLLYC